MGLIPLTSAVTFTASGSHSSPQPSLTIFKSRISMYLEQLFVRSKQKWDFLVLSSLYPRSRSPITGGSQVGLASFILIVSVLKSSRKLVIAHSSLWLGLLTPLVYCDLIWFPSSPSFKFVAVCSLIGAVVRRGCDRWPFHSSSITNMVTFEDSIKFSGLLLFCAFKILGSITQKICFFSLAFCN